MNFEVPLDILDVGKAEGRISEQVLLKKQASQSLSKPYDSECLFN